MEEYSQYEIRMKKHALHWQCDFFSVRSFFLLILLFLFVSTNIYAHISTTSGRAYYNTVTDSTTAGIDEAYNQQENNETEAEGRSYYDSLVHGATKRRVGRDYYNYVINKATERRWVVPISAHYAFVNRSFDDCSQNDTLANLVFSKTFTLKDIFLFSKLSDDNNVHIDPPVDGQDSASRFQRGYVQLTGHGS